MRARARELFKRLCAKRSEHGSINMFGIDSVLQCDLFEVLFYFRARNEVVILSVFAGRSIITSLADTQRALLAYFDDEK